jgi:hypothetical protein
VALLVCVKPKEGIEMIKGGVFKPLDIDRSVFAAGCFFS